MNNRSILTCTALFFASVAVADTQTLNGYTWTYAINGDSVEIYGVSSEPAVSPIPSGEVIIPSYIDEKPVTSIGDYSFCNCSNITRVTLPVKLSSIGYQAFYKCSSLDDVTMPDGLKTIGYSAFQYCSSMREIRIPDTVVTLGACAFSDCYALSDVSIGRNVSSLEKDTFANCRSLTQVTIPSSVKYLANGRFRAVHASGRYSSGGAFIGCENLQSVFISEGCGSIGAWSFHACTNLKEIHMPTTVTNISNGAFSSCPSIKKVALPGRATVIDGAYYSSTTYAISTLFPDAYDKITEIAILDGDKVGSTFFSQCGALEKVTLPDTIGCIEHSMLSSCTNLTNFTIPNSVTNIGASAFSGCKGLTSLTIPDSVTVIEDSVFYGCSSLEDITIPPLVTSIGKYAFAGCTGLQSLTIPDSVTYIGSSAFSGCKGLTSLTIPDSVTVIEDSVFYGCSSLEDITISPLVTSIGKYAFAGCTGLQSILIPSSVITIGDFAFSNCNGFKGINIPDSVLTIGDRAFSGCNGLADEDGFIIVRNVLHGYLRLSDTVVLPDTVIAIGHDTFSYDTDIKSVTIPASAARIGDYAFNYCRSLTNVTFKGDAPNIVGKCPFLSVSADCTAYVYEDAKGFETDDDGKWNGLTVVRIAREPTLKHSFEIDEDGVLTHVDLNGTTELVIPGGVVRIHENALDDCYDKITSVAIPPSVTNIDTGAFAECNALTAVYISDLAAWCDMDFQTEDDNPLYYAHNLYLNGALVSDLRIPGAVDKIGAYAFCGCASITNAAIPNTVALVGGDAFLDCGNLESASLPPCLCNGELNNRLRFRSVFGNSPIMHLTVNEGVTYIADLQCHTVTGVDIPSTVVDIGDFAFEGCSNLESITLPSSITNIGERAFGGCENLTAVYIEDLLRWCTLGTRWRGPYDNPLYYAHNLYLNGKLVSDLCIPEGVEKINNYAFYGCASITNVTIHNTVTRVGTEAFAYCTNLASATVPQCVSDPVSMDLDYFGSSMEFFRYCPLVRLKIAEGATSIGYDAFGSDTLAIVEIPNTVTNIGDSAFFYSPSLTRIEIPDSVEEIGDNAFRDCQALTNIVVGTGLKRVGYRAFDTYCEYTDIHIRDMAAWCGIEFLGGVRYNDLYLNGELVEDLVIPDGVTEVPGAFGYYKRLVHVTIPASVTNFTEDAFSECTSLKSATFLGDAPDHVEYSGTFRNVSHDFIVYIPRGNDTYELDAEGRWHGMAVVRYGSADETTPNIAGDNGAVVEESADCDFTILPSVGNADVVVIIPDGIEPANVTVEVNADVATVKPNGAAIKVVSGGNDITAYISEASLLPDVYGVVNLAAASLDKAAVFEEDTPGDNAESVANVIEAALDDNVMESTVKSAKPGLYYSMEASNDIAFPNDVAKTKSGVAAMARSNTVIIAKPEKPAGKAVFYRIKVSKAAK